MTEQFIPLDQLYEKHDKLQAGECLLDVRSPDEYKSGHIPGAKNIPHTDVAQHADELKKYSKIYIYCRMGRRAQSAYESLKDLGLDNLVATVDAGFFLWMGKGYPTTS